MKYVNEIVTRITERDSVCVVERENRCGAWAWNRMPLRCSLLLATVGNWWSRVSDIHFEEERGFGKDVMVSKA